MSARIDLVEGSRIALFSLTANRLRTVLTTVGVGIGVATLLAILSVIQGLNAGFDQNLAVIGANTLYIQKFPWSGGGQWWRYRNRPDVTVEQIDALRSEPFVIAVAPSFNDNAELSFQGHSQTGVQVVGTVPDYLATGGLEIDQGRMISGADNDNHQDVVVLGSDVVQGLFGRNDPIGQHIKVGRHPLRVIGTFKRKGGGGMFGNPDLKVVIPLKTFQAIYGRSHRSAGMVLVDSPAHVNQAMDHITGTLRRLRQNPAGKEDDFAINRADEMLSLYNKLTGALYGVVIAVGLITLLVGGIGIMNIMLVSVRERTREIGLRRALGARKRTIITQFLLEAAAVSAVGGALGALTGLGIAKVIAYVGPLDAGLPASYIVGGVLFAGIMGLVFGIWPAARAANLDPVEALRYE